MLRALMMIAATGETVHTSREYGHVDFTVRILNFISVKKQQISTVKNWSFITQCKGDQWSHIENSRCHFTVKLYRAH